MYSGIVSDHSRWNRIQSKCLALTNCTSASGISGSPRLSSCDRLNPLTLHRKFFIIQRTCMCRYLWGPINMRLVALLFILYLCLTVRSLDTSNIPLRMYERRGPHSFPLPQCPAGARLCDFFNGAYCYNETAGDSCCGDGTGKSLALGFRIRLLTR